MPIRTMNRFLPRIKTSRATRLLAVDWNQHEARYVLVESRRGTLSLVAAGREPLAAAPETDRSAADVGAALRHALAPYKVGRVATLVTVDRALLEWEPMSLPPAADEELPGLVLNQISQQLPSLSDQATVDFFAVRSGAGSRNVVAVALPPSQLARINQVISESGLSAKRIGIRAMCAASLVRRLPGRSADTSAQASRTARGTTLAVDAADDMVDLTLLQDDDPILVRTIRLAGGPRKPDGIARLVQEIRRSLAAFGPAGRTSETVGRVVLFGKTEEWQDAADAIRAALAMDVQVADPFELAGLTPPAGFTAYGGFAGLLGALVDESQGQSPAVDFLHPKRVAPPRDRRRPLVMGAAIAATALVAVGLTLSSDLAGLEEKNDDLATELKKLDGQIKRIEPRKSLADAVVAWQGIGVNWLDEIRRLSERLPASRDVVVLRMSMGPNRDGGGSLTYQGVAREPAAVQRMEAAVRDSAHEVQTPKIQQRPQDRSYAWEFETTVNILPHDDGQTAIK